jgi:hypothetical protein
MVHWTISSAFGGPFLTPQHPKDFSLRERSDEREEMSQRNVCGTQT